MTQSALGIVDKMRIEVYDDSKYSNPKKTIFVQLNPDKYTMKHNVVFCEGQPMGASENELKFNKIESEVVKFEFMFDSTGVVPPGKIKDGKGSMSFLDDVPQGGPVDSNSTSRPKSIAEDIEAFRNLLLGYNGSTHETAYLQLIWGAYHLKCRLKTMDIQFNLFRNDGMPLRAIVSCEFHGTSTFEIMLAEQKKSSPDMTHEREFTMGDKLTLMAEKIYENPNFYIDVAKANSLPTFRNIAIAKKIQFPPIK